MRLNEIATLKLVKAARNRGRDDRENLRLRPSVLEEYTSLLRSRGSHVWWVLLGHIGIPLLFGVAFVLFSVASNTSVPTWDIAVETALNFAILGIGATGAIFENDTINQVFKEHSAVVGITVVGVNFLLAALVVLIRRFIFGTTTRKLLWGIISIILGSLALVVTSEVLAYAYGVLPVAH